MPFRFWFESMTPKKNPAGLGRGSSLRMGASSEFYLFGKLGGSLYRLTTNGITSLRSGGMIGGLEIPPV